MGLDIQLEKCITKRQYTFYNFFNGLRHYRWTFKIFLSLHSVRRRFIDDDEDFKVINLYSQWFQKYWMLVDDFEAVGFSAKDGWHPIAYKDINGKLICELENSNTGETKCIDYNTVPTYKVKVKVIYTEIVGSQRKGVKDEFYDLYDAGKLTYFVVTQDMLDLLYSVIQDEYKESFKKNIYDKFCVGKNFITLSW